LATDSVVEVVPEGDAEFAAGFLEAGKCVAATATVFTAGAATDLAPLDVFADVALAQTMPRPGLCRVGSPRRSLTDGRCSQAVFTGAA